MKPSRLIELIVAAVYLAAIVTLWKFFGLAAVIGLIAVGAGAGFVVYIVWLEGYRKGHPEAGFLDTRFPGKTGEDEKLDLLCEWVYLSIGLAMGSFFLVFFGSMI